MNYDLNKLLNYPLLGKDDIQDLTQIIFRNVLRDDFSNDFEYMKIATDYYSEYYIPVIYDEDAGYRYITEDQLVNFMHNFCFLENHLKLNGLDVYQEKIDKIIKDVLQATFFKYEDFNFTIENPSYAQSMTKILKSRLVGNV